MAMTICVILLLTSLLFSGYVAEGLEYDYTASVECLVVPHKAQYDGGIITNPNLNQGLHGWSHIGHPQVESRVSETTNNSFIVAHSRTHPDDSVSQKVYLQKDRFYSFSAWIQVSGEENVAVTAGFKTSNGELVVAGAIVAEPGCWSMLKGGLTVNTSDMAHLYFYSRNSAVDVWIDSVSLQPFTQQEWKSHQDRSVEQVRKRKVKIQVIDKQGNPLANATVSIRQNGRGFPFGCAINKNILTNDAYRNWFVSRGFGVTVFENEMKWSVTEYTRGHEDYSAADALLQFAKQNNMAVRGHNVVWDSPIFQQPKWLSSLSRTEFESAFRTRINSVVSRYRGQVITWDVVNENLHGTYLEGILGRNASALAYNLAHKADGGSTPLYLNEYNTIEFIGDLLSTPARYLRKIREIREFGDNYKIKFGIGLEAHFAGIPNIPYMRAAMDTLAAAKLPIWLTEVDVKERSWNDQALYLEQVLREGHSHPSVEGIMVWGAWSPQGCYRMCLTDDNFKNRPAGDVVDKLLHEWGCGGVASSSDVVVGRTGENGYLDTSLFHGDYNVTVTVGGSYVAAKRLSVDPSRSTTKTPLLLLVQATT